MKLALLSSTDRLLIKFFRRYSATLARGALFIVFFWFGALKIIGASPANPLVNSLLARTAPSLTFNTFIVVFGIFEMIIGVLFLVPKTERLAIALLVLHMIATILPLFLMPSIVWNGFMIPTLEGQYIIKNITIIALAVGVAAHLRPIK